LGGVENFEKEVGALGLGVRTLDSVSFDIVRGVSYACGVDESEWNTVEVESFLDGITGGASSGRNDGAVMTKEEV